MDLNTSVPRCIRETSPQMESLTFTRKVPDSEAGGERLDEIFFSLSAEKDISWKDRI